MTDPNAPWIENRPQCPDCDSRIESADDHDDECPLSGLGKEEIAEMHVLKGVPTYD